MSICQKVRIMHDPIFPSHLDSTRKHHKELLLEVLITGMSFVLLRLAVDRLASDYIFWLHHVKFSIRYCDEKSSSRGMKWDYHKGGLSICVIILKTTSMSNSN